MSYHSKHEGETTHRIASVFYHFYGNEMTRAECPGCENRLMIEKENALKDVGFRFWRIFIRYTNGEVYLPLKQFLFGGLFKIRGFIIVRTSGGEDMIRCCDCGDIFFISDVNDEFDVVLTERFHEEMEEKRRSVEENYREAIKKKRPTDNFILPDGTTVSKGFNCVMVKHSSTEGEGVICDILKIHNTSEHINIESILAGHGIGVTSILKDFEKVDGSLIAMGSSSYKTDYEGKIFNRHSPHYYEFSTTTFRSAVLDLLKERARSKYRLYRDRISPFQDA